MRTRLLLATLLLGALFATTQFPEAVLADSPKVMALLKERRDLLAERLKLLEMQHGHGEQVTWKELVEARDELLVAELALATTKPKRIEVLTSRVENLKSAEELYMVQRDNGDAGTTDVLKAKARRLAAEVDLQREIDASSSGKPDLDSGKVSGIVTLNGMPLANATIKFQPKQGPPSVGKTNENGEYSLKINEKESGAVVGEHTVSITTAGQQPETLPARYNTKSSLTVSITSGENVCHFELHKAEK